MRFPWQVAAIAAVGIPVTSWILGRSPTANIAVIDTPNWLFATVALIAVAGVVGFADPILGLLTGYVVVRSVWTETPFAFEGAQAFAFGSLLLICASRTPAKWKLRLGQAIGLLVVFQAGYAVLQELGYSPLWMGWTWFQSPTPWNHGTLGNPNHLGSFLAMAASVIPGWAIPFAVVGMILSRSVLGALTLAVVLVLRFGRAWRPSLRWGRLGAWKLIAPLALLVVVGASFLHARTHNFWWHRRVWYGLAIRGWLLAPVFGFGMNSWQSLAPILYETSRFRAELRELYGQAHSDPLQLLFEGGAVAFVLALMWIYRHRDALLSREHLPKFLSVLFQSLGSFPFRIAGTASLAVTVLGLAVSGGPSWQSAESRPVLTLDLRKLPERFWQKS